MTEREWVKTIIEKIENSLREIDDELRVTDGLRLPYSSEILAYSDVEPSEQNFIGYETDILIFQKLSENDWKPRIIVEAKSTHDAITYRRLRHIKTYTLTYDMEYS